MKKTYIEKNPALAKLLAGVTTPTGILAGWTDWVIAKYGNLATKLPPEHQAWRSKADHAQSAARIMTENNDIFGFDRIGNMLASLLVISHDLGRLEQVIRGGSWNDQDHGKLSAEILRATLPETNFNEPFWKAALIAVRDHSLKDTPSLDKYEGDEAVYALVCLLRYVDKMTAFDKASLYTSSEEEKRKQLDNWKKQRVSDEQWGLERGEIMPTQMVEVFTSRHLLIRQDCESYEAYMLQLLAWPFDIAVVEIIQVILKRGGYKIVYDYLNERLQTTAKGQSQWEEIQKTVTAYLKELSMDIEGNPKAAA